jgi:DNA-binding transcriptional MocR family regulator
MSIDSIVTMTIWERIAENGDEPIYVAIADAIAKDVDSGELSPGAQLPTHRELAQRLGVTVGTVTRGYAEAERRGLVVGEVGRGTFVRGRESLDDHGWGSPRADEAAHYIDLSLSTPWVPPDGRDGRRLAATLRAVAEAEPDLDDLLRYAPESALERHRAAGAAWLTRLGLEVAPSRVVVTGGAQHALHVILSSYLGPGETLLTEELTYPGLKAVTQMIGVRLRGVALDEEGLVPESLDRACQETGARAVYCVPTLQNPTCATMSPMRRLAIAEVARRHDLLVLEDGVHAGVTGDGLPAIASVAPERTFYLATLSKSVAFGLRVSFIAVPDDAVERVRAGVRATIWMAPPLMLEIATRWLADGTAEQMAREKRDELAARHAMVREVLGQHEYRWSPGAHHIWLQLEEPWRSQEFVAVARQNRVRVAGAEAFAIGRREVPHAVRVSISGVPDRERLRRGLELLSGIVAGRPGLCDII